MNDPRTPDGRPIWLHGNFIFGFFTAIVLPPLTLMLFSHMHGYSISEAGAYRELIKVLNIRLLSASVIINVGVFFLGLKLEKELFSRGILYGTVLVFVMILLYKYV